MYKKFRKSSHQRKIFDYDKKKSTKKFDKTVGYELPWLNKKCSIKHISTKISRQKLFDKKCASKILSTKNIFGKKINKNLHRQKPFRKKKVRRKTFPQ